MPGVRSDRWPPGAGVAGQGAGHQPGPQAADHEQPGAHEHQLARDLDASAVAAQPAQAVPAAPDGAGEPQERDAETQRVPGEQQRSGREAAAGRPQRRGPTPATCGSSVRIKIVGRRSFADARWSGRRGGPAPGGLDVAEATGAVVIVRESWTVTCRSGKAARKVRSCSLSAPTPVYASV